MWQQLLCSCMNSTQLQPAVADLLQRQEQQLGKPAGAALQQHRYCHPLTAEWQHLSTHQRDHS